MQLKDSAFSAVATHLSYVRGLEAMSLAAACYGCEVILSAGLVVARTEISVNSHHAIILMNSRMSSKRGDSAPRAETSLWK